MKTATKPRPTSKSKPYTIESTAVTHEQTTEFQRLDQIVRAGMEAFAQAGEALARIHHEGLWRAGGHASWEAYCRNAAGFSKAHAFRLMKASQLLAELKSSPIGDVLPVAESQLRPLLKLESPDQRAAAWNKAVELAEDGQPTALHVAEAVFEVLPKEEGQQKPESRIQLRKQAVNRLRGAIESGAAVDQLRLLLEELEKLI